MTQINTQSHHRVECDQTFEAAASGAILGSIVGLFAGLGIAIWQHHPINFFYLLKTSAYGMGGGSLVCIGISFVSNCIQHVEKQQKKQKKLKANEADLKAPDPKTIKFPKIEPKSANFNDNDPTGNSLL